MTAGFQGSPRIFINYRRADTAPYAGRLYDRLAERYGSEQAFMDIGTIEPGIDFAKAVEQAVTSCEIVLALIGPSWIDVQDEDGRRRIDKSDDLVRMELQIALNHRIAIIPVLIDGARMPTRRELPLALETLADIQPAELRAETFRHDVERLFESIENLLRNRREYGRARPEKPQKPAFVVPPNRIFISYNHIDRGWLDRLLVHLRPLERQGRFEVWNDRQIQAGDEWREEIKRAIASCQAAVLLVSADFIASDFIYNDELPPLLEAGKDRGVRIIPVLVSSSSYDDSSLSGFQAVNPPSEPLDLLTKGQQEAIFVQVYKAVKATLNPP